MSDFLALVQLGVHHITDLRAMDHLLFLLAVAAAAPGPRRPAHPLHTSIAEISDAPGGGQAAAVRIQLFADDLAAALAAAGAPPGAAPGSDSAMARYARAGFTLADPAGRPVTLRWGGAERSGDLVLVHLAGVVPGGLAGARVGNTLLFERFDDQINVVRASYGGRTASLVFTRGDGPKTLP